MNETLNLTLSTNPLALIAAGALVWTVMFGILIARTSGIGKTIRRSIHDLSRDIAVKDFGYKPKFDERNGGLKIGPHVYSEAFPVQYWL